VHVGWKRTGLTFQAIKAGEAVAGSVPICRFYGSPTKGLDSHFYSVPSSTGVSWSGPSRFPPK
jgi:hypothetical protein